MTVKKWPDWADREARWVADAVATARAELPPTNHPGQPWAAMFIAAMDARAEFVRLFEDCKPEGDPCA